MTSAISSASSRTIACVLAWTMLACGTASAQHPSGQHTLAADAQGVQASGGHPHHPPQHSHYAGMQQRAIKALSPQQIADLREGKGMSMALPAELNGYPGPLHTLQLAEPLQLTPAQVARTQALFAQMQEEARSAGEAVITAEAALDALFRDRQAQPDSVSAAVARAAKAQAALRETHLRYHLPMMEVLSATQVSAYQRLRGY